MLHAPAFLGPDIPEIGVGHFSLAQVAGSKPMSPRIWRCWSVTAGSNTPGQLAIARFAARTEIGRGLLNSAMKLKGS
ncbi:hypothetical protein GCM10009715_23250 [Paeniglutamicibacter psychrophenolicus]